MLERGLPYDLVEGPQELTPPPCSVGVRGSGVRAQVGVCDPHWVQGLARGGAGREYMVHIYGKEEINLPSS